MAEPDLHLVVNCRSGAHRYAADPAAAVEELDAHADQMAQAAEQTRLAELAANEGTRDALDELRVAAEHGEQVDARLLLRLLGPVMG